MSVSASGIPNVPARSRPELRPGCTPLAQSHIAHINERPGTVSGITLVRCIGAAVALPGLVAFGGCLCAFFVDQADAVSALVGMVIGAEFAAVGWGIVHFAYLAGPVSAAQQAEFSARHHLDL